MLRFVFVFALFAAALVVAWQWTARVPREFQQPFSRLRVQGPSFRILHVTDTQIRHMSDLCQDYAPHDVSCDAYRTIEFLDKVMRQESPDVVIFGGDNVWGEGNLQAKRILRQLVSPMLHTPVVLTTGNHDQQNPTLSLHQMYADLKRMHPQAYAGDVLVDLTTGEEVYLQIYVFAYRTRVQWRHRQNQTPAMVVTHIPIPEYNEVDRMVGTRNEPVTWREHNEYGNLEGVVAMSTGHDHTNDFCGLYDDRIWLCNAGSAGFSTWGKKGWRRRVRMWVANITHLHTYKVLDNMERLHPQWFPLHGGTVA
jgi:calcineurin-like phosphoesterase family protein